MALNLPNLVPKPTSSKHTNKGLHVKGLDGVAKRRYLFKLQLLGLDESDDPYISQDFLMIGYISMAAY